MPGLKWKGELADGEVHMTAREYCDHKTREKHEEQRQLLRKLANNPILTEDIRRTIRYAVYVLDDNEFLMKMITELHEQIDNMKERMKRG